LFTKAFKGVIPITIVVGIGSISARDSCPVFGVSTSYSEINQYLGINQRERRNDKMLRDKEKRSSRRSLIAASVAVAALLLSACSPGGSNNEDASDIAGISKEFSSEEKINLILATWEDDSTVKALVEAFQAKHPNVSIKIVASSFNDYLQNVKLQMSSDEAPDVVQAGQGYTMMGPLVQAGSMRPIDDYAKLYGWADRFGAGLLDQSRFEKDGKKFGTGDLYGVAMGGNMVGVFYNRAILDKLKIKTPFATLEDFQKALNAAQAAGYIPMGLGNLDAWPGNHTLSILISQTCDNATLLSWIYGQAGADFSAPCFLEATKIMEDWGKRKIIDPKANGIGFDDAVARFAAGNVAFFVTGNWALPLMAEKAGDGVGFTGFPPLKAGGPARATGATTSPFGIGSASKYPDVAAAFIDFMTGPDTADIRATGKYAPLITTVEIPSQTKLIDEYYAHWKKVIAEDGLTLFLDWSSVGMGNVLFPAVQELLGGRVSSADLVTRVQAEWAKR